MSSSIDVPVGQEFALQIIQTGHYVRFRKWWQIFSPTISSVDEGFTT